MSGIDEYNLYDSAVRDVLLYGLVSMGPHEAVSVIVVRVERILAPFKLDHQRQSVTYTLIDI
jgi:hypothetical protein